MARLNKVPDTKAWCAAPSDTSPYLQIDLGRVVVVTQIAVAGKSGEGMVTKFKLSSSDDGGLWQTYTTISGEKVTNILRLSHAHMTRLRHELFRINQTYNLLMRDCLSRDKVVRVYV